MSRWEDRATTRPLVVPIRESPNGPVVGGLSGYTWAQWLFIELFVLPEIDAGKGCGNGDDEIGRGRSDPTRVRRSWLDTHSFQARPFYEKLGYTVFGVLENFPPGHTRYYLRKSLAPAA